MITSLLLLFLASVQFLLIFGDKPIPSFPLGFTARTYRNTTESSSHLTINELSLNVPARRASMKIITSGSSPSYQDGIFSLIFRPDGADPGSPADSGYVLFSIKNETSQDGSQVYCSYSTDISLGSFPYYPPNNFPPQWSQNGNIEISGWFYFPPMDYLGTSKINGVTVDVWESPQQCSLFGEAPVSCFILYTQVNTAIPKFTQMAYQKLPNTFQEDWLQADQWLQFTQNYPTIPTPPKWSTTCYNIQNGFDIFPVHGYVATPTGRDNFTVALTTPPISSLGDVLVTIVPSNGCTGCPAFEGADGSPLTELTFTMSDWNVPQMVYIRFVTEGEAYFYIKGVGGGYEIRNWETGVGVDGTMSSLLRVLTCVGIPGYGCDKRK